MSSPSRHSTSSADSVDLNAAPNLRFPTLDVNEAVGIRRDSTGDATMSTRSETPSEEHSLADSSFEFVESEDDDHTTESIASLDYPAGADDVASLADTQQSADDSQEDEEPSVPYYPRGFIGRGQAEDALNTPTLGRSSSLQADDLATPLIHSIEFEEPELCDTDVVNVKHTVGDYKEAQSDGAVQGMAVSDSPQRLVVTIRQTMSRQGLSTRDPLRILYVGSHSAKQDIIHKIASSVTASVLPGSRASRAPSSQLYNVVPVSAFGSERTPEIELMQSSGYQIKVEDCDRALSQPYEEHPQKPDLIKLCVDDAVYNSVPEGEGFLMSPEWEVPHIAIFYCSENDNATARRTMTTARKFMGRHKVPSIVISHEQTFDRRQCISIDQRSVHMCLESRGAEGRGSVIHRRAPIDLTSFLNIDARQMNRNLAHLTGLHDSQEPSENMMSLKKSEIQLAPSRVEQPSKGPRESVNIIRNLSSAEWKALLTVTLLLLSALTAVFRGIPTSPFAISKPEISINSKVMPAGQSATTASNVPLEESQVLAPIPAAIKTSTKTITVTHAEPTGPNSLSVVPSMELGKPSQKSRAKPKDTTSLCTAEVLGDREILIRIPSATKLSWLTNEAISVNITRDNATVDTERAYSSDEGVVLLLAKNQAYGVLNISITTTRKPRVNETLMVDFGTTIAQKIHAWRDNMLSLFLQNGQLVDPLSHDQIHTLVEKLSAGTRSALSQMEQARILAVNHATAAGAHLTEVAKSVSFEAVKSTAILTKEIGIQLTEAEAKLSKTLPSIEDLKQPLDLSLLKAQVASKLIWLKVQGKSEEYAKYKVRATEATRAKEVELKRKAKENHLTKKLQRAAKKEGAKERQAGRAPKAAGSRRRS